MKYLPEIFLGVAAVTVTVAWLARPLSWRHGEGDLMDDGEGSAWWLNVLFGFLRFWWFWS